jgi:5-methylthioadenosine/S-adenosylhomocysteine deaminase
VTDLILHSDRCVLGESPGALRLAAARVVLRDGTIASVEEGGPADGAHRLGGQLLAPAFVNAHTHLALHACRGLANQDLLRGNLVEDVFYAVEEHLQPADVEAFARVAALECLLAGVGTVFDHYYHGSATARAVRECGLAAIVAPTLQDVAGPGSDAAEAALAATVELDQPGWARAGIRPAVGPHATDTVSVDLWRRALEIAEDRDLLLHAHVAQSAEETLRCLELHGCGPVEWMHREGLLGSSARQLLVHGLFVSDAELKRLDSARHALCACPYSQMQFGFPAPVPEWEAGGAAWFIGTDTGASNDSMDVQKELRAVAGMTTAQVTWSRERVDLRAGISAERVAAVDRARRISDGDPLRDPRHLLHRIWAGPGKWCGGLKAGVIEEGARAQLLVIDPEHPALWPARDPFRALAFGSVGTAITGVIAAGRWVGEPGDPGACLREPVAREWFDEANRRHRELMERAGAG